MDTTFRLGRIAGIDVGVNWTWFAIFGLIVWTLSQNVFPSENPGLGNNTYQFSEDGAVAGGIVRGGAAVVGRGDGGPGAVALALGAPAVEVPGAGHEAELQIDARPVDGAHASAPQQRGHVEAQAQA